jgi:hypothetical protein
MSKVKMKCARCGKHYKSSNAKQTLCPSCIALERQARASGKSASARPTPAAPQSVARPRIVGPGAGILVPGLAQSPGAHVALPAVAPAARPPAGEHAPAGPLSTAAGHATETRHLEGTRAGRAAHAEKPARAERGPQTPRPPREPRPATPPFELTDELRARVEARYLELAQPVEFDGIRTQIAGELAIPKVAVKRAVRELRARMQLPSWWELQSYKGTEEDLARIRAAYEPLLPVPEIGVHRQIASALELDASTVYQGIRRIRAVMHLPQYNPPSLHETAPQQPTRQEAVPIQAPPVDE